MYVASIDSMEWVGEAVDYRCRGSSLTSIKLFVSLNNSKFRYFQTWKFIYLEINIQKISFQLEFVYRRFLTRLFHQIILIVGLSSDDRRFVEEFNFSVLETMTFYTLEEEH